MTRAPRRTAQPPTGEERQGPQTGTVLSEALPGLLLLGLSIAGATGLLAWIFRAGGLRGLVVGVPALVVTCAVTAVGVRWRRAVVRRRRGRYTPAELSLLDEWGVAEAVERMLRRDGWDVVAAPRRGEPRLLGRDAAGRHLEVSVRFSAQPDVLPDTRVMRLPGEEGAQEPAEDDLIRLVVSPDEPARPVGGVQVVDRAGLCRWAAGAQLESLL